MNWKTLLSKIDDLFASDYFKRNSKKLNFTILVTTLLLAAYLLSVPYLTNKLNYKLGDIASEEVRVPFDIQYVLPSETEALRKEAAEKERYVFDRDYAVFKEIVEELQVEFQVILRSFSYGDTNVTSVLRGFSFLRDREMYPLAELKKALTLSMRGHLEESAVRFATYIYDNYGVVPEKFKDIRELARVGATTITINTPDEQKEILWDYEHILFYKNLLDPTTIKRFEHVAKKILDKKLNDEAIALVVKRVLTSFSNHPPVQYNEVETEKRKTAAATAVKPVTATLKKGLTILRQGDPIDKDKLRKVEIYNSVQDKSNVKYFVGNFIIQMMLLLVIMFYIDRFTEIHWDDFQSHLILHSILFFGMLLAFVLSRVDIIRNSEIYFALYIPVSFMVILSRILFGPRVSIAVTIYYSFFLFFLSGRDTASLLFAFVVMMSSIYLGEVSHSRSGFLKGSLLNALAAIIIIVGIEFWLYEYSVHFYLKIFIAIINTFVGTILTLGILPLYEAVFNLPTRFRLMELSDFDHPLLRKIASEAPSTYTHSLMMSSLSERAVARIGGDALLTRVGCMYHDLGKTSNPSFFAENKHLYEDKEIAIDKTSAVKYASIIIKHVVEGVRMAKEARLPKRVIDFIPEHHGDSLIRFFYTKALANREAEKLEKLDLEKIKEKFRYPGPKPRSKETGVVMLADSVEAASRALPDPTEENLTEMIEKIANSKIAEHQLDNCPLTMADLQIVKETFVEVLVSSFHVRPQYPTAHKTEVLEKAVVKKNAITQTHKAENKNTKEKNKSSTTKNNTNNSHARAAKKTTSEARSSSQKKSASRGKQISTKTKQTKVRGTNK